MREQRYLARAIMDPPKMVNGDRPIVILWLTICFVIGIILAIPFSWAGGLCAIALAYLGIKFIQYLTKRDVFWRVVYLASLRFESTYDDFVSTAQSYVYKRPYGFGLGMRY